MFRSFSFLAFALLLAACQDPPNPLMGTWEMIDAKYTDADTTITLTTEQTKILTATHFAFGRQQEEGAYAGGGPYLFDGTTYTEIIDYHSNSELIGDTISFDCRIEGDSLWYHSGDLGTNFHLEEIWRRVSK